MIQPLMPMMSYCALDN